LAYFINFNNYICKQKKSIKITNMSLKNSINVALIIVGTMLVSCQGNKSGNSAPSTADSVNIKQLSEDVKDVVYPLPTPFEMTRMLNDIGARYVSSSLNPADKAEKYFTEKSKAINLGVYAADLAYAATFDQKQDIQLYSKAIKTLVDDLGINIEFSSMLSDEFKEKINNKDTLAKAITNTYYATYKNLGEKSNKELSILMVSGMWVELMYIATHISEDTYNNTNLVNIIAKQKDSYVKLMALLDEHSKSKEIKELQEKLVVLKPAFDQVDKGLQEKDYKLILKTIQDVRKSLI